MRASGAGREGFRDEVHDARGMLGGTRVCVPKVLGATMSANQGCSRGCPQWGREGKGQGGGGGEGCGSHGAIISYRDSFRNGSGGSLGG